ncbi:alpha/beta hydrolase fold domain-containing protein [Myceligenerans pegani]|uniref:Alpha/beta hydrolase fold domain-containing protein n=1 Tax=Myceligenerans pegani TaxID=2776917 RepID=A0ABR9N2M4_9MICO|nr:alpha/beta hydrolase fold domain-containing protein [Myceligenerans sp. TRM 65318]MBE1877267.1 alpha/beta hydrolase fold domain-containing protein [Myceligenerans sp. TRM 65318]MBE3019538.1 alpha/beta hydrolase fold domain-containing protein [Myceligenerans sp. TRM 65318]
MPSPLRNPRLAAVAARGVQALHSAAGRRLTVAARHRLPEYPGVPEPLVVPTPHGEVTAWAYRPPEEAGPPPPVYVNLHGGGFVLRGADQDDPWCRLLAAEAGVVVLNVDYDVAPQARFPVPPHQVHAVLDWAAEHGAAHGWDGRRLSVGGQSAGGALAAAASRLAFERARPRVALQVLHYPPLDLTVPAAEKHSPLAKPLLRPWMGDMFDAAYIPDAGQRADRLASPAAPSDTADLTGIAPAVVIACEHDILRAEARRYADRLESAGALVAYREIPDRDHGYDISDDATGRETYTWIAKLLRETHATA